MSSLAKFMLSSILITVIVLGLNNPVAAQEPPPPLLYVEAPESVPVCTEFDIIIWILDIENGFSMTEFALAASFDPEDVELLDADFLDPDGAGGWVGGGDIIDTGEWRGSGSADGGAGWTEDRAWFLLTFHCLRAGPTEITVSSPITPMNVFTTHLVSSIVLTNGQVYSTEPDPVSVTIQQEGAPVGGVASPVNKLEIIAPYLVLAGLVIAVSAIVIKKRKD